MLHLFLAASALAPQGPGTSTAPVVINEFVYDDGGTDNFEFVELYNRSLVPVDISGWKIVCRDEGSPTLSGVGTGGDVTNIIEPGTILAAGAFYVVGMNTIVPVVIPSVAQQTDMGLATQGTAAMLENGPADTVELWDLANNVIDSVVYEIGGQPAFSPPIAPNPAIVVEGFGIYGDLAVGDTTPAGPDSSCGRVVDGLDNDQNSSDFVAIMRPTPGASNNTFSSLPYNDNFDNGGIGADVNGWITGFVPPQYIDPTQVSAQNLNPKPPSPQGGLAMSVWDSTGGGNGSSLDTSTVTDIVVETYVYLDGPMAPVDPTPYSPTLPPLTANTYNVADGEWWCLGVRGTITGNSNPPDVPGTYYADIAQGVGFRPHWVTGIAWAHFRTPTYSRLFLVDLKDGPSNVDPVNMNVIGFVDIVTGLNDGWQRIRLQVQGNEILASFGGTYGCGDGTSFYATTTTTGAGNIYVGYREALLYNVNGTAGCHPPVFDEFTAHAPTTTKTFFGTGSPQSNAVVPQIGGTAYPLIGTPSFAINGSSMLPGLAVLALGFTILPPPGFPVPGAPAGTNGYLVPDLTFPAFPTVGGDATVPLPIPCAVPFLGAPFATQWIVFDAGLAASLQIAVSGAMQTTIGN
ncbi:MAG: lamin tail domain-containing protein [Planctomycetota bacterium]